MPVNKLRPMENLRPISTLQPGACCGELALMYNTRQVTTIVAREDAEVYAIGAKCFKDLLSREAPRFLEYWSLLDEAPLLSTLLRMERGELARSATGLFSFKPHEVVLEQGNRRSEKLWYVVDKGSCVVTEAGKELARLRRGDHFGERWILRNDEAPAESVTAGPEGAVCLLVDGQILKNLRINLQGWTENNVLDSPSAFYASMRGKPLNAKRSIYIYVYI